MKKLFLELCEGEWHKNADHWGVAMSLAFDIAGEAYKRGLANVLEYRPGAFGPEDIEDEWKAEKIAGLSDGELSTLCTYTKHILDALERAGKSY